MYFFFFNYVFQTSKVQAGIASTLNDVKTNVDNIYIQALARLQEGADSLEERFNLFVASAYETAKNAEIEAQLRLQDTLTKVSSITIFLS